MFFLFYRQRFKQTKVQFHIFPAVFVFCKMNIFNYLVFASFLWIGEFWDGGSVDWWSVSMWSVVCWLVVGGFNNALSEYASTLDLSKGFLRKKIFYNSFKNIFDMKCSKDLERVSEYRASNPNFTQTKYIFV